MEIIDYDFLLLLISHIECVNITFDLDLTRFGIVTAAFVLLGFLHGAGDVTPGLTTDLVPEVTDFPSGESPRPEKTLFADCIAGKDDTPMTCR